MKNITSKDSHNEKHSVFSVTYHEIGETYTWLKENVTEKLSSYLLACWESLAHHNEAKIEEELEPADPLKEKMSLKIIPENTIEYTENENIETNLEIKKEKKGKKKGKKEKKNKKK